MMTMAPVSTKLDATDVLHRPAVGQAAEAVTAVAAPRPAPAADEETWWERWRLVVAAVSCWSLLAAGFALDRLTAAPHPAIVALYVGAYLAGGAFSARFGRQRETRLVSDVMADG